MRHLIIILMLVLVGCEPQQLQNDSHKWFVMSEIISEITENMADRRPGALKTFVLNGVSESKKFSSTDTSFWRKELAPLAQIDLNSAQIRDAIEFTEGMPDKLSNLLIDEFRIVGAKELSLKKVRIYYLENPMEVRQIQIEIYNSNLIADSEKSIKLWLNRYNKKLLVDSIKISGRDKTLMQPVREYQSTTKTAW